MPLVHTGGMLLFDTANLLEISRKMPVFETYIFHNSVTGRLFINNLLLFLEIAAWHLKLVAEPEQ
jgi:hypothetical protein